MKTASVVLIGGIVIAGFIYEDWHFARMRALRDQVARAEAENKILEARDAKETESRRKESDRLAAMEARVGRLRANMQSRGTNLPRAPREADGDAMSGVHSFAKAANAGQSTAMKAFETAIWATYHGEVESMGRIITLDAAAQERADRIFASLPPESQAELKDARTMTALLIESAYPSSGTYEVVWGGPSGGNPTEWILGTKMVSDSGQTTMGQLTMRQVNGAWSLVVPEPAVQHLEGLVTGVAP
jgi:hypothetical protein